MKNIALAFVDVAHDHDHHEDDGNKVPQTQLIYLEPLGSVSLRFPSFPFIETNPTRMPALFQVSLRMISYVPSLTESSGSSKRSIEEGLGE